MATRNRANPRQEARRDLRRGHAERRDRVLDLGVDLLEGHHEAVLRLRQEVRAVLLRRGTGRETSVRSMRTAEVRSSETPVLVKSDMASIDELDFQSGRTFAVTKRRIEKAKQSHRCQTLSYTLRLSRISNTL